VAGSKGVKRRIALMHDFDENRVLEMRAVAASVGNTSYIPAGATLNGGTAQTNALQAFDLK
jgi:hypothetical protein